MTEVSEMRGRAGGNSPCPRSVPTCRFQCWPCSQFPVDSVQDKSETCIPFVFVALRISPSNLSVLLPRTQHDV